jgi:hypothetical protein
VKKPLTAETAETAEKETPRILGVLCVLCGETAHFFTRLQPFATSAYFAEVVAQVFRPAHTKRVAVEGTAPVVAA